MLDKKTRLNSAIRDQVVKNALNSSGYFFEEKQLVEDRAEFAARVHSIVLAKDGVTEDGLDRELAKLKASSSSYISASETKNTWMRVNLSGISVDLSFNGAQHSHHSTHLGESWGEKSLMRWIPRDRPDIADQDLKQEFLDLATRQTKNTENRDRIESTVRAVLRSVSTVGKLLESWPEAVELLPDELVTISGTGLAVIPADLNALCGIPSAK